MTSKTSAPHSAAPLAPSESESTIAIDVEQRKPRLAWQGMERKELAGGVPTQVVEIVRPGRAVERKGELDLSGRAAAPRDELLRPDNRLIWTNDNVVALQTLLADYAKISCIDPSVELLRGFGALVNRAYRCLILTRMFIVSVIVVILGATGQVRGENQSLKLARGV